MRFKSIKIFGDMSLETNGFPIFESFIFLNTSSFPKVSTPFVLEAINMPLRFRLRSILTFRLNSSEVILKFLLFNATSKRFEETSFEMQFMSKQQCAPLPGNFLPSSQTIFPSGPITILKKLFAFPLFRQAIHVLSGKHSFLHQPSLNSEPVDFS